MCVGGGEIKKFQNSDIRKLYFVTRCCNFLDNQNEILNMSVLCPLFLSRFWISWFLALQLSIQKLADHARTTFLIGYFTPYSTILKSVKYCMCAN